jgi:hypothetical protein
VYDERCDYDGHEWRCGVRMLTMMMMRRRKPAIDDEDDAARVRMMVKMMHREMHGVGVGGWGVGGYDDEHDAAVVQNGADDDAGGVGVGTRLEMAMVVRRRWCR